MMSCHHAGLPTGYFEGDVVIRQGGADLNQRGQAQQPVARAMWRHQDAVDVGVLGDPLQFGDAADVARIGTDDIDRVLLDEILEVLAAEDLLPVWIGVAATRVTSW
jgi:hypothetical protein